MMFAFIVYFLYKEIFFYNQTAQYMCSCQIKNETLCYAPCAVTSQTHNISESMSQHWPHSFNSKNDQVLFREPLQVCD